MGTMKPTLGLLACIVGLSLAEGEGANMYSFHNENYKLNQALHTWVKNQLFQTNSVLNNPATRAALQQQDLTKEGLPRIDMNLKLVKPVFGRVLRGIHKQDLSNEEFTGHKQDFKRRLFSRVGRNVAWHRLA